MVNYIRFTETVVILANDSKALQRTAGRSNEGCRQLQENKSHRNSRKLITACSEGKGQSLKRKGKYKLKSAPIGAYANGELEE